MRLVCRPDDVGRLRDTARSVTALYVGGMGARGRIFSIDLFVRIGFEEAAAVIRDRYPAGDVAGAEAAVPDAFLRDAQLIGEASFIAERLGAWRAAGVTMLDVTLVGDRREETVELLAAG